MDGFADGGNNVVSKMITAALRGGSRIDFNPNALLPTSDSDSLYYKYSGSLTNPPCDPVAFFMVAQEKLTVNNSDIDGLRRLVAAFSRNQKYGSNNRPLQERRA